MALTFQPFPIPQQPEEPDPYASAGDRIQKALTAYAQYKMQKQAEDRELANNAINRQLQMAQIVANSDVPLPASVMGINTPTPTAGGTVVPTPPGTLRPTAAFAKPSPFGPNLSAPTAPTEAVEPTIKSWEDWFTKVSETKAQKRAQEEAKRQAEMQGVSLANEGKTLANQLAAQRLATGPKPAKPKSLMPMGAQNGQLVFLDPNTPNQDLVTRPLPGGGTLGPKTAPTVPAEKVAEVASYNDLLTLTQKTIDNYDPAFVGMWDKTRSNIAQMTGRGATAKAATFKQSLAGIRTKLLNMLSGAAISPEEFKRLDERLPSDARSEVDFNTRIRLFQTEVKDIMNNRMKGYQQAGYNTNGFTPFPQAAVPNDGDDPAQYTDDELIKLAGG